MVDLKLVVRPEQTKHKRRNMDETGAVPSISVLFVACCVLTPIVYELILLPLLTATDLDDFSSLPIRICCVVSLNARMDPLIAYISLRLPFIGRSVHIVKKFNIQNIQ